jgi:16S rRNA (cytosine967-C5)-methyltransferase
MMHAQEPTLDLTLRDPDAVDPALATLGFVLPGGSLRLTSHMPVQDLPGYAEGTWWVQDAAAALAARLLLPCADETVLDMCAAPGGKTAVLATAGGRVTALDRSAERLKMVQANMERLGLDVHMVVADALTWPVPSTLFDAIFLDAPCSATGTLRRHPDVAHVRRPGDIGRLVAIQSRLLDRALMLLRPGGRLVYAVCSLEPEEGEQQIAALLRRNQNVRRLPIGAEEIGGLTAPSLAPCLTPEGDLRTLPVHLPDPDPRRAGLDGFYAARLVLGGG